MLSRFATITLLLLAPALAACDQPGSPDDSQNVGGKADAIEGDDAGLVCPAAVYVSIDANEINDHVYSNCHNAVTGRFAPKACCAEELDLIEDVSGCPAQVTFTETDDPSDKRCVNDVSGHDGQGQFVKTACCAPLCDETASFDEHGYCRTGLGVFEEEICCIRNLSLAGANCTGAEWEAIEDGNRDFACRAPNGQFAMDACCVDQCAEAISRSGAVPEGCNLDDLVADECPEGSTPNAGGICHNPENGQFVKAACCVAAGNTDELDVKGSDSCWIGQQTDCG
jgi:hypothetical protein